jgi:imidazolonepropionase-like amidohydrolase
MTAAERLRATILPDGDRERDLWVVDGRLTFLPPPGHVEELARPGGFVLPGLVDSHTHLTLRLDPSDPVGMSRGVADGRRQHAAAGTLVVRDIGSISDAALRASSEGSAGAASIVAAGPFLAPASGYFGFQQVTPVGTLAAAAADVARAGYPWVKVIADWPGQDTVSRPNYDVAELRAAVAAVHALGARLAVHAGGQGGPVAVEAGVDSIEHGFGLDDAQLVRMAERGIAWTPTAVIVDRAGFPPPFVHHTHEVLAHLLARAEALGVSILAGTDILPGGSVGIEVAELMRHGLSPVAALAAATTTPRRFLGLPGVDDGAPADLVVYAHDPRDDPDELLRSQLVLHRGVPVGGVLVA